MIPVRPQILIALFGFVLAPALPVAATEGPTIERYRDAAGEYQRADAAGKLRFLEDLLARSNAAASVTSTGAELSRVRKRNRAILERAAQGRELTGGGLLELLAEVDAQEQRALAKLRRDFAFSTAQAFHDNRAEFDKWHDAWERIEQRYEDRGRPLAWQQRMIDWLALASARQAQISLARTHPDLMPRPRPKTTPLGRGPNIQLRELEARIAGYNLAAARLFSELHAKQTWSVEELGTAAGELTDLATLRHDLDLYWKLLPEESQARIVPLRTLDDVIPLLARRTVERRRALEVEAANSPRAAWELRRLDEVSRRLATLAMPRG